MYSTNVYFYIPRQLAVVSLGPSTRRYSNVIAKNLKLHKGSDNKLQFQIINQEQKPVDVTGREVSFRLISDDGKEVLIRKALTPLYALTGIMELNLSAGELQDVHTQLCNYSIQLQDGTKQLPVFVDGNADARGTIEVLDSITASFVPSADLAVPNHELPSNSRPVTYYSSVLVTDSRYTTTIQANFTNYTGTVKVQGSSVIDSDWYDVSPTYTYTSDSEAKSYVIEGFHVYLRLVFVSTQGDIARVLVR